MEREAKDGTIYRQVGPDQWEMVARRAKNGQVYKALGNDQWEPMQSPRDEIRSMADDLKGRGLMDIKPDEALEVAGRAGQVADSVGGFMRSGLFNMAGLISGKGNIVKEEDLANVAYGKAPDSDEYYRRMGVPKGPEADLNPLWPGKTSARGALGLLTDIATGSLRMPLKEVRPAGALAEKAGKSIYKSGLKKVDQEVARYGKEPVSDVLFDHRITGNAKNIFKKMDDLGNKLYGERQEILKEATRKGAEVDMKKAMSQAQAYVDKLKKTDNPELRPAVQMMQNRINKYLEMQAKESEQFLRELPRSEFVPEYRPITGFEAPKENFIELPRPKISKEAKLQSEMPVYMAEKEMIGAPLERGKSLSPTIGADGRPLPFYPGESLEIAINNPVDKITGLPVGAKYEEVFRPGLDVGLEQIPGKVNYGPVVPSRFKPGKPATVLDETERIAGPTPLQTSSWKTTSANKAGDTAWQTMATSKEGKAFEKALSGGLRKSTEDAVGKLLGQEKALELARKNADLGKILTSKERALLDAEQELRKNLFTSVDGMILGAEKPTMLVVKKLADALKMTGPRTKGGLLLHDAGKSGLLDAASRQGLINASKKKKNDEKRN